MGRLRYLLGAVLCLSACDDADPVPTEDAALGDAAVDQGIELDDGVPPDAGADMRVEGDMQIAMDLGGDQAVADMTVGDMAPDMTPPPDLGPPVGEVLITRWQTDARFAYDEVYGQAIFAPALIAEGLMNPVGYLLSTGLAEVGIAVGPFALPAPPGSADELPDLGYDTLADIPTLNAGNALQVGDALVINAHDETIESAGAWIYESLVDDGVEIADLLVGDAFDLYVSGGEGFPETTLPGAVRMPAPVVLRDRNPFEIMPLRFGVPVTVEWVPTPDPDDTMVLVAESFFTAFAIHVDDDLGAVDLTEFFAIHGFPVAALDTLSVIRRRVDQVATGAGTVQITTHARQVLLPEQTGPYTVSPRILDRGAEVDLTVAWWDGHFADPAALDLGPGVAIQAQSVDSTGQIVHLRVAIADDAPLGPRPILGIDDGGEAVTIPNRLFIADELPMQGTCADASEEPPLQPGTWRGSFAGLADSGYNTEACLAEPFTGRDQAIPVRLRAGETLVARLLEQDGLLGLYVIDDCADRAPIEECYVRVAPGEVTEFRHTAYADEALLLIVDDQSPELDPDALRYVLDYQILPAEPLLMDPNEAPGGAMRTFEVTSTRGAFAEAPALTFDDVPVAEVERVDDQTLRFTTQVPDDAVSRALPVEASLADGSRLRSAEGVRLVAFRLPPSDCAGADVEPPLAPGVYSSFTDLADDSVATPAQCPEDADGPDAVYRVELDAGQTARFWVIADNFDPVVYLLHACAPVEAVECVDNSGFADSEHLVWTAGPEPVTLYLVVDGYNFDDAGSFFIEMEVSE